MVLGSRIRDPRSGIRDPEKNLFRIPDPGVKKAPVPDPGSGSPTLPPGVFRMIYLIWIRIQSLLKQDSNRIRIQAQIFIKKLTTVRACILDKNRISITLL
jgi:hypothetical protein